MLSYSYDGFLETGVSWSGTVTGSIGRAYNSDFRVTSTTVNSGSPVTYQYDADGLVTKAGELTLTRNTTNGLISGTSIGQVTDTRSYNSFGELTGYSAKVSGSTIYSVTYTRDSLGRISQKVETIEGQTTTYDYGYDAAGRLVQVTKTPQGQPAMTTTYAYDANGNRLSKTEPDGTVTQGSYDNQDRLLTYGNTSYTYNSNGDLTSKTQNNATVTYDYDVFGNLRMVVLDSGQVIEYVIDGRNRRIGKKIDGVLVQGYLYDDQLRPIAELDGSNQVVATFVYGTHVNVPELIVKGTTTYRILHDHLGSARLVIDQTTGAVAQRLDYDEWGIVTLDTSPGFQPFGFAGGLHDTHTKLVKFGARDYDPHVGRWTAKDPIALNGGPNLYAYAMAEPVDWVDPTGLAGNCCDDEAIRRAIMNARRQLGRMRRGLPPEGERVGGAMITEWATDEAGNYVPFRKTIPWLNPDLDPCVRFCVRIHELVHYYDTRPVPPAIFQDHAQFSIFLEWPAYSRELRCLERFVCS